MKQLNEKLQKQLLKMINGANHLFRVSSNNLWEIYLASFEGEGVFRCEGTHNCNTCHQFIDRYANIVAIDENNNLISIWDIPSSEVPEEYKVAVETLSKAVKAREVMEIFTQTIQDLYQFNYEKKGKAWEKGGEFRLGLDSNVKVYTEAEASLYGGVKAGEIYTFNHLSVLMPRRFMVDSSESIATLQSKQTADFEVLKKGLETIELDTLETIKDLIDQNSLLGVTPYEKKLKEFLNLKKEFVEIPAKVRNNWMWKKSAELGVMSRFANELIGVLCFDIQNDGLNKAVMEWNKRIDPINWMKTKAPITQKQINEAAKWLQDNNYEESFVRRFATIEDIETSEIKFLKSDNGELPKAMSIFDSIKPTAPVKKLDKNILEKAAEITIDDFINNILPTISGCEVFMKPNYNENMVSLLTANKGTKPIFKWGNNYSWNYSGGLAGKSQLKAAVKNAGGRVDAPIRFSIMWNEDGRSIVDLDAHAIERYIGERRDSKEIYYGGFNKQRGKYDITRGSGQLDIDMIRPSGIGVENITWGNGEYWETNIKSLSKIELIVENYDGKDHFGSKAEVEIFGEIFQYNLPENFKRPVKVAEILMNEGKIVKIDHKLDYTLGESGEIWGCKIGEFIPVKLICLSPNYWEGASKEGNKHYMFFLEGAECPDKTRTFHNEMLKSELLSQKRVLEVLGETTRIEPTPGIGQLNGLGFNSTVRDELFIRFTKKDSGSKQIINTIKF